MKILSIIQGIYYLITGIWPIVSLTTFYMVTGPKTDGWLVKTVGVLTSLIGLTIILAGAQDIKSIAFFLGVTSTAAFLLIDLVFVVRSQISAIYLWDALLQGVLGAGWLILFWK
jgi:hypothetical protein